jgi:hypothetical protein
VAITRTLVTPDIVGQGRVKGQMSFRAIRVDNNGGETSSVADFATAGLGNVLVAYGWNRTTGAAIAVTISALTTVTSAAHSGSDDVTLYAWGTVETPAQLA